MLSHLTGLSEAFGNVSNPQYLLRSHTHAGALNLLSGVPEDGCNIRVLIGEPGTGKTILLLRLLEQFQDSALTAHLFWTQLGRSEFLRYFLHELGVLPLPDDIGQARKLLTGVLEREFGQGRKVIVAIDEAHNLEIPTLCGFAELLDSSLARSKELQVVFAGLPHLTTRLASPEVQGIWNRISAIASLSPLTSDETTSYINRRLEVFGYHGDGPFTSDAMTTIATLAEGIPRNINNICFAALYLAEQRARSVTDSAMVLEAAAHTVTDSAMALEAAAQRERRPTTQETTQQSIASLANLSTAEDPIADQQTPGRLSVQQHIPATGPADATPFGETAGNTTGGDAWVGDEAIAAVSNSIRQWFGKHRMAWSGTVGELAAAVDQPESEVGHALHANSEILQSFGIAVSVCEMIGRTRSVSLRRLEEREHATAEEANTGPRLPEWGVDGRQGLDGGDCPPENLPNHGQSINGMIEEVPPEDAPAETAPVSPADQALDLLRANLLRGSPMPHVAEARVSRSRWAVLALLIALGIGLGWTYTPVLKRRGYVLRVAQQLTELETASKAMIAGRQKRRTVPDRDANAFSSRGKESPHAGTVPPVSVNAQPLSGTRVLEEDVRPDAGEATKSFQQAALSGDPNAQFELGTAYALGRGVPADRIIGYTWLTLAFANGNQQAETLIRQLTRKLSQSEIARGQMDLGNDRPGGRLPPPSLGRMLNNPFLGTYYLRRKSGLAADDEALYLVHRLHAFPSASPSSCGLIFAS